MITKVKLDYFKRFESESFDIESDVVLAGPNNSGKSTLLQAVSVWNLALQRWMAEHAESSKAKQRTGVPISRGDFTAIPLREMNLLWFDRDTAYSEGEKDNVKAGQPKLVGITLYSQNLEGKEWHLKVTLRYTNKEQIHVKLADDAGNIVTDVPNEARDIKIVHVPPFSGIGAEETGFQLGFQNRLIGQGKPGDVLRNLLLEVYRTDKEKNSGYWKALVKDVFEIFGYELKEPQYAEATDPFIRIEYTHKASRTSFDIASAGSGFHQVLTLLGFFYARSASILLLDEPDAHLHVILQRQVYDRIRTVARRRGSQLIVSTHSEIILEDTEAEDIISFYGPPHRLKIETDRDQVRKALKRLSSLDILRAENKQNVLYVEDESDYKILEVFSNIINHSFSNFAILPFVSLLRGCNAHEAKAHFFALKSIYPNISGVLLLDGDNRNLPDHEISAEKLTILRWHRYEIENYLLHPNTLLRFVAGSAEPDLFSEGRSRMGEEFLRDNFPPAALKNPLKDSDYLIATPASKSILPEFFKRASYKLSKKDYFQIAEEMKAEEIHPEIIEKLDAMAAVLNKGLSINEL
jgi:predicted ATPase